MYHSMKFVVILICVHVVRGSVPCIEQKPFLTIPNYIDIRTLGCILLALLALVTTYFVPALIRRIYSKVGRTAEEQMETAALYNSKGLPVILQGLAGVYYPLGMLIGRGNMADTHASVVHDTLTMTVKSLHLEKITDDKQFFIEQMDRVGRVVPFANNVIPLRGYIFSKARKLLIFDMVEGSTLSSLLHGTDQKNQMDLEFRIRVAIEVAKGIKHIHSFGQQSVHANLKSSNILITTDGQKILVSEMGLVPLLKAQMVVDHGYNAPEIVRGGNYTHRSDIYSFGVLLLELLTGQEPHQLPTKLKMANLKEIVLTVALGVDIYDNSFQKCDPDQRRRMVEVALDCINDDPKLRPSILEVVARLCKMKEVTKA